MLPFRKKKPRRAINTFHVVPFDNQKAKDKNENNFEPRPSSSNSLQTQNSNDPPALIVDATKYGLRQGGSKAKESGSLVRHEASGDSPGRRGRRNTQSSSNRDSSSDEMEEINNGNSSLEIFRVMQEDIEFGDFEELEPDGEDALDEDSPDSEVESSSEDEHSEAASLTSDTKANQYSGDITYHVFQSESSDFLIVVLKANSEVTFTGMAMISSLFGKAELMGYEISPNTEPAPIYAPFCTQLPILRSIPFGAESQVKLNRLKQRLSQLYTTSFEIVKEILTVIDQSSTIVLLKPVFGKHDLKVKEVNRLFNLPGRKRFLKLYEKFGFSVGPATGKWLLTDSHWRDVRTFVNQTIEKSVSEGEDPPRILVCGDIRVGKSTLSRFLMNSSLKVTEKVMHLEGDPGQCEFTPSGLVSLTEVRNPLLGPPFTHQTTPKMSCYVGGKTVESNPALYVESMKKLLSHYGQDHSDWPLFINTMGWVQTLGLALLIDLIRIVKPTLVVQITSHNMPPLTLNYMQSAFGWSTLSSSSSAPGGGDYNYNLITLNKVRRSKRAVTMTASKSRELAFANYVSNFKGKMLDCSLSLLSCTPLEVPWSSIALHSCISQVSTLQLLHAINASWVALCAVDPKRLVRDPLDQVMTIKCPAVNRWIGFGVVRGVNFLKETILLSTPVPLTKMQEVNALLLGIDDLPTSLLLKTNTSSNCQVPFLSEIRTSSKQYELFQPWKKQKKFFAHKKRRTS